MKWRHTFFLIFCRRAKLIQSLRNKISHSPSRSESGYIQPISDLSSHVDDEYPHPKHGTLKNEILNARSRMSKKPPAPTDWTNPNDRRSNPTTPNYDSAYPPKDYPGFAANRNSQQYNRRPYLESVDNYPTRNSRGPGALSKQEADVMNEYDKTIANEERNFSPYSQGSGFLHGRYVK